MLGPWGGLDKHVTLPHDIRNEPLAPRQKRNDGTIRSPNLKFRDPLHLIGHATNRQRLSCLDMFLKGEEIHRSAHFTTNERKTVLQ